MAHPMLPEALTRGLFLRQYLLRHGNPDAEEIRPVLIIEGGGTRGICASAQAIGLLNLGFGNTFKLIIGYSAGAAIGSYFLAGLENLKQGTALFHDDLCRREFIKWSRLWKIEDMDLLISLFRSGHRRLDVEAMHAHTTLLNVVTTRKKNGELVNHDGKVSDPFGPLKASAAIPILYPFRSIRVGELAHIDGGLAFDLERAVQYAIDTVGATHVLVLTNRQEQAEKPKLKERIYGKLLRRHLRILFEGREERHDQALESLSQREGIAFGALHLPEEFAHVSRLSMDGPLLKKLANKALQDTLAAFGKPNPEATID